MWPILLRRQKKMQENPYKFTGPLDPIRDKIICIQRVKELDKVISGIRKGDYWTVMGPRQIGKTTFLRQLMHEFSMFHCIYVDLEVFPTSNETFYDWIIDTLIEKIPTEYSKEAWEKWKHLGPELNFYYFLRAFKPRENKRIILFFDEIEKAPSVASFLHIWRKVFHERADQPELSKYSVIIAGAADLIALTIGPTSPFNIAQKLYLTDLTNEESVKLIDQPFKRLGITFEATAKAILISQVSGHPQLLQHLCSILVDRTFKQKNSITDGDIAEAIDRLFYENSNLQSLDKELKTDKIPKNLIRRILNGEKIEYIQYQEFSMTGTGPIKQHDRYCAIRNKLYERLLSKIIDKNSTPRQERLQEPTFMTTIYLDELPHELTSTGEEANFLKCLFNPDNVKLKIAKNHVKLNKLEPDWKEKLIFCYLAYKNYKAIKKGFSDWKKIPFSYEYRLSSNIENNEQQKPEWQIFKQILSDKGIELIGDEIRVWIHSLRRNLKSIGADDIIHTLAGRGKGYLLKGTVNFAEREGDLF